MPEEEVAEEMRKTRRTLHQIGSVNPFAIEEHRELSARLGELSVQEADLSAATRIHRGAHRPARRGDLAAVPDGLRGHR